jgi:glutamate-1-semialdehyde aminotransferase
VLASGHASQTPVLRDVRLRALYLDAAGTAVVDLAAGREMRVGVWDELLAVYALVNTLTQDFPEVKQVRFLIDGREASTLAGHLDLSRAFVKRTDLVKSQ